MATIGMNDAPERGQCPLSSVTVIQIQELRLSYGLKSFYLPKPLL